MNKAYKLYVPYQTGAIYKWFKDGVEISNENQIYFANFTATDDGKYVCKVQWGNCVQREVHYILNSGKCDEPLNKTIAGTVYNDPNGLANGQIDGTATDKAGDQQLYMHLLMDDHKGNFIHTSVIKIESNGTFSFSDLQADTKYRLILSTKPDAVEASTPIPSWKFTGETDGATPLGDGMPNGVLDINLQEDDMKQLRFGIKRSAVLRSNRHITTKL